MTALAAIPMASAAVIINFTDTALADIGGIATPGISDTSFSEGSMTSSVTCTLSGVDLGSIGGGSNETITIEYEAFANPATNPTLAVFSAPSGIGVFSSVINGNANLNRGIAGAGIAGEGIVAEITSVTTSGGFTAATSVEFTEVAALMFGSNTSIATVGYGSGDTLQLEAPAGASTPDSGSGNKITYTQDSQYSAITGLSFKVAVVPEPTTTALLGLGGLALILRRRK